MAIMKTAYNKATKKRISYHTLSPQLKTGDLVLFAGTSWSSRIVQLFTFSQWSHIGVVVRLPQYDNQPLLWELTRASKLADIEHGVLADGLQLVPLADKIKTYAGQVAIRRLKHGGDEATRLAHLQHLLAVWQAKPYCNIVKKNLQAWWRGEQACTIGLSGGFCSHDTRTTTLSRKTFTSYYLVEPFRLVVSSPYWQVFMAGYGKTHLCTLTRCCC
jgi:hypothetical protein